MKVSGQTFLLAGVGVAVLPKRLAARFDGVIEVRPEHIGAAVDGAIADARERVGLGERGAQDADHAVVRMHAHAMHQQDRGLRARGLGPQAEELAARGELQRDGVADHEIRLHLRGPPRLARVILPLRDRRDEREQQREEATHLRRAAK